MHDEDFQHSGVFATVHGEPGFQGQDEACDPCTGLDITMLNMLPSDEAVYFVRRCARQLEAREPSLRCSRVVVEKLAASSQKPAYRVTICADTPLEAVQMSHLDADLYLAVRDAFENASLELGGTGAALRAG